MRQMTRSLVALFSGITVVAASVIAVGTTAEAGSARTVVPGPWSIVPSADVGTKDQLAQVSCVTKSFCVAVGL